MESTMKTLDAIQWEVNLRMADLMHNRSFRLVLTGFTAITPLMRLLVRSH
jgi:hypothetical protein